MNKTVLITGGARGIGKEIATLFASEGYNVLINYNQSEKMASLLVSDNIKIFKADVSNREQVDNMIKCCLDEFGRIDVVINNAGITKPNLFTEISEKEWDNILNIDLKGTFNVTQQALKEYMINEKNGSIINISSIYGITGASCEVAYSSAKSGVIGMTKALAKELAMSNITVNAIAPGAIATDMLYDNYEEDDLDFAKNEIPMKKFGEAKDIAYLALYLASDKARYITGQVISPNGGSVI